MITLRENRLEMLFLCKLVHFLFERIFILILFNLNAKSQFLLHLLVSDLHAFVLVRPSLLVHLRNHQSQQN